MQHLLSSPSVSWLDSFLLLLANVTATHSTALLVDGSPRIKDVYFGFTLSLRASMA
jgi:hypothetical protein